MKILSTPKISQLARAENLVDRIAQAEDDVAVLVQVAVERGGVNRNVGMRVVERLDTLRRGNQHQCLDVFAARSFQKIDGGNHRTRPSPASGR